MCGFAFSYGDKPISNSAIRRLLNSLEHRGPDDCGVININNNGKYCTLVHTRLAIIDSDCPLSKQPFESIKYWIGFNGEIYNYKELRKSLKSKGYRFRTNSDTEIIAAVLDTYGPNGISQMEGMWSFVAVDKNLDGWIASKDFFGEKPLFVYESSSNDLIASTPRQIEIMSEHSLEYNDAYIEKYLIHGHRGALTNDDTVFRRIRRIKSNTTLIKERGQKLKSNTVINPLEGIGEVSKNYGYEHIYSDLRSYINKSFQSDTSIKVSCLLSGGLDSSLIASLWNEKCMRVPIYAYTLRGTDKRYDESEMVNQTVRKYENIDHKFVDIDPAKSMTWLNNIIRSNRDVLMSPSAITGAHIFNAISHNNSKVALTGIGGDELFAGYLIHHLYFLDFPLLRERIFVMERSYNAIYQ